MVQIYWEHGFKRLTTVLSLICVSSLIIVILHGLSQDMPTREDLFPLILIFGIGFIIASIGPWFLFFLIRFIIRGFLSSGTEK